MEKILIHKDPKIESLAHEIAMAYVIEEFKKNFSIGMIKSCQETGWMLNAYYQAKRRTIYELVNEYTIIEFE